MSMTPHMHKRKDLNCEQKEGKKNFLHQLPVDNLIKTKLLCLHVSVAVVSLVSTRGSICSLFPFIK